MPRHSRWPLIASLSFRLLNLEVGDLGPSSALRSILGVKSSWAAEEGTGMGTRGPLGLSRDAPGTATVVALVMGRSRG